MEREERKKKQIEERRIVYVGKISNDMTRRDLRELFDCFGDIEEVSVHFREDGDNYGFVTFCYTCDAYAAIERGNSIHGMEHFDLCFGGRREFCKSDYADLDGNKEDDEEMAPFMSKPSKNLDFDELLRQAMTKSKKSGKKS
jgi:peroxisome proliferator-activated receptor gamma coactivator-related protein 1